MSLALWKDLRAKKFAQNYVLVGEETFLRERTGQLIIDNALLPDELDFNLSVIDLEETPIEQAVEAMETAPFLGERRVVILKNAMFLTGATSRGEKVNHHVERLITYLDNPVDFTIAVFVVPYEKLDSRKKVTKALVKAATVFQAKPLKEAELVRWVQDLADQSSVKISREVAEAFVYRTGTNLQMIEREFEKVTLHISYGEAITAALIEQVVSLSLEQNVFSLVEKIVQGHKHEAIQMYRALLIQKEEPIKILALIARQYRIYVQVKYLIGAGYGATQMASKLKMSPYPVKLAMEQLRKANFTEEYLLMRLDELAEIDFKLKTGYGDRDMQLELFILKN